MEHHTPPLLLQVLVSVASLSAAYKDLCACSSERVVFYRERERASFLFVSLSCLKEIKSLLKSLEHVGQFQRDGWAEI